MNVFRSIEAVAPPLSGVVLTVGNFDGVHRGHRQILARSARLAADAGATLVAMTFDPHPLTVVAPSRAPALLAPVDEKLRWFADAGVDVAVVAASEPEFLSLSPEAFIDRVVMARFKPRCMVEGASFGFGRGRTGDVNRLAALGRQHGFDVEIVEPVRVDVDDAEPVVVSSSMIRAMLTRGQVEQAARCLGHPYALLGQVVRGAGRGRGLGFPTANLRVVDRQLVPAQAVYAGRAEFGGRTAPAAISIGINATFGGTDVSVEAHLLDVDEDLYDAPLRLELLTRIRDQQRFDSPDALRGRLVKDIEAVRASVR